MRFHDNRPSGSRVVPCGRKKIGVWLCWTRPWVLREYVWVSGKYFLWDMRVKWKQRNGYMAFI